MGTGLAKLKGLLTPVMSVGENIGKGSWLDLSTDLMPGSFMKPFLNTDTCSSIRVRDCFSNSVE